MMLEPRHIPFGENVVRVHESVLDDFNRCGVALLAGVPPDRLESVLLAVGALFGAPQFHEQSDARGVFPITRVAGRGEYANATTDDLPPHTDGTFERAPPKALLMVCVRASELGGDTLLVDGRELLDLVQKDFASNLRELETEDCFSITRDGKSSTQPLFRRNAVGHHEMCFRYGGTARSAPRPGLRPVFDTLLHHCRTQAQTFRLREGELLVLDNTRVLHGRTAFPESSNRHLHALWVDGRGADARVKFGIPPGSADGR